MIRSELEAVLEEHKDLLTTRSIDFFAANTIETLDASWREYLEETPLEDVARLLSSEDPSEPIPESLKTLKCRLKSLEFRRKSVENPRELWKFWTETDRENGLEPEFQPMTSSNSLIRKRIKAKKQHEIDRIVELIAQIQTFRNERADPIDSLVDIGAGVGHLSRVIALKNQLSVLAVEGNQQFTLSANSLDEKLLQKSSKIGDFSKSPVRFTSFVTESLATKIDEFAEKSAILVGLHCCGDFSTTILRVFARSKKAKALVLLGCCYHKQFQSFHFLHPEKAADGITGLVNSTVFPLSQKWAGFELDYVLRESACHNNENLRFSDETPPDLARYARAHLEKWIWSVSDDPADRNMGLCSVKCEEGKTTFEEYIRKAMAKRGNHLLDRILEKIPESCLSVCVSSMRCSLFDSCDVIRRLFAPAIESAILDDRREFLRENGFISRIVPLFEPTIIGFF